MNFNDWLIFNNPNRSDSCYGHKLPPRYGEAESLTLKLVVVVMNVDGNSQAAITGWWQ